MKKNRLVVPAASGLRGRTARPLSLLFPLTLLIAFTHAQAQGNSFPAQSSSGQYPIARQNQSASKTFSSTRLKLQRIIIPKLTLTDATLKEAVDKLRQLSRQCDTAEGDPEKKGVNFIVQPDPLAKANDGRGDINLSLQNIPLGEAIKYVVEAKNLTFRVDPFAVVILPISEE